MMRKRREDQAQTTADAPEAKGQTSLEPKAAAKAKAKAKGKTVEKPQAKARLSV